MNIKAIPTFYNGVQFRSRLEARWASFFDLIKWPWAYEAIDLDGWIPDFILGENLDTGIPCEVKPIDFLGLSRAQREQSWKPYASQLKRATDAVGPNGGFLLLGARPFWGGDFYLFEKLGYCLPLFAEIGVSFYPRYSKYNNQEQLSQDTKDDQLDFVLEESPYHGAITGRIFDHNKIENINEFITWDRHVLPLWKQASNAVQWKAP